MNRAQIEETLACKLSTPLPAEELEDVVQRVALLEEQAALLRALPLGDVEPSWGEWP